MSYNPANLPDNTFADAVWQILRFGLDSLSLAATHEILILVSFPLGTEMFHFPRLTSRITAGSQRFRSVGFPHSDIYGSKVAWHLPEAYRCHAASFIAFLKPRHPPYALIESFFGTP